MAEAQLQEVIATMMSVADFKDDPNTEKLQTTWKRYSEVSRDNFRSSIISTNENILKDSQDNDENNEEFNFQSKFRELYKNYSIVEGAE